MPAGRARWLTVLRRVPDADPRGTLLGVEGRVSTGLRGAAEGGTEGPVDASVPPDRYPFPFV
jgi:hypothetical protein